MVRRMASTTTDRGVWSSNARTASLSSSALTLGRARRSSVIRSSSARWAIWWRSLDRIGGWPREPLHAERTRGQRIRRLERPTDQVAKAPDGEPVGRAGDKPTRFSDADDHSTVRRRPARLGRRWRWAFAARRGHLYRWLAALRRASIRRSRGVGPKSGIARLPLAVVCRGPLQS